MRTVHIALAIASAVRGKVPHCDKRQPGIISWKLRRSPRCVQGARTGGDGVSLEVVDTDDRQVGINRGGVYIRAAASATVTSNTCPHAHTFSGNALIHGTVRGLIR